VQKNYRDLTSVPGRAYRTSASSTNFARSRNEIRAGHCQKSSIALEDLMKLDKVPTSVVQTLKTKRDELFRQFENQPWKLSLATEIKVIDDQIAEESREKKKAWTDPAK
jgi:hypothetical protein